MKGARADRGARRAASDANMRAWSWAAFNSAYLPALILAMGSGVAVPAIPAIARSFHVDFAVATGVTTSFLIGGVAGTLPGGWLIDHYGRRRIMLAGPVLTALMAFAVVLARTYPELLALRFADGVATQLWLMGRITGISHSSAADQRGRQITWMFGMDNAGRALGPLLGGLLAARFGIRSPFVAYGLLALVAIVPAYRYLGDTPAERAARARRGGRHPGTGATQRRVQYRRLISSRIYFFAIALLAAGTRGPIQASLLNIYGAFRYQMGPTEIGYLAAVAAGIMLPTGLVAGWLIDRYGRKRLMIPGYLGMALAMVALAITAFGNLPVHAYVGAFVCTAFFQGLTNGSVQTIAADVAPPEARGTFFGLWRLVSQSGVALSPLVFAALSGAFGYGSSFLFVGACASAVTGIVACKVPETGAWRDPAAQAHGTTASLAPGPGPEPRGAGPLGGPA